MSSIDCTTSYSNIGTLATTAPSQQTANSFTKESPELMDDRPKKYQKLEVKDTELSELQDQLEEAEINLAWNVNCLQNKIINQSKKISTLTMENEELKRDLLHYKAKIERLIQNKM